jgi:glutathione S-transferase
MMKLYNDATSPFGRKVMIAAIERAIPLEEVFVDLKDASILDQWNPLRQVPTLVLAQGQAVFDSDVIMTLLDSYHAGPPLLPKESASVVMTRMSLANGIMETTLRRLGETRREAPSPVLMVKFEAVIARGLQAFANMLGDLTVHDVLRADHIAVIAALGYVDLRYADTWRNGHPALAGWYAQMAERRSVELTAPSRTAPVPRSDMVR